MRSPWSLARPPGPSDPRLFWLERWFMEFLAGFSDLSSLTGIQREQRARPESPKARPARVLVAEGAKLVCVCVCV